jgi:hypothetical protein
MVVITGLAMLHLGISLTLFVGLFYLINLVSLLVLTPGRQMDWLENKLFPPVFSACNQAADFCRRWPYPFSWQTELRIQGPAWLRKMLCNGKELLVSCVLIYTICWNLANTPDRFFTFPENLRGLGFWLRIDQNWGMFSPAVFKDDGWYILEGLTNQAQKIDLNRTGQPVTYLKPEAVVSLFKNDRWRKYSENYLFVINSWMRPYYCHYLMRIWNEKNAKEKQVKSLEVIYMKEVSRDHYRTEPVKREVLCSCGEE